MELAKDSARGKRTGLPYSLIMLDLDKFKNYNDEYGHVCGDKLLVDIANLIQRAIRDVDLAVRYGGEEFLVIIPDTETTKAREVAERIRRTIEQTEFLLPDGITVTRMTVSLGVATVEAADGDASTLISRADSSLYQGQGKRTQPR